MLLFTLYVVAGGVWVKGELRGTPLVNGAILGLGTVMASVVGTTGAAMILVRPAAVLNMARLHNAHVLVFFILLVANIGGAPSRRSETPLCSWAFCAASISSGRRATSGSRRSRSRHSCSAFLAVDFWFYRKDRLVSTVGETVAPAAVRISGAVNFVLIAGVIGAILASATWKSGIAFSIYGTTIKLEEMMRDAALLLIAVASLLLTPNQHREANGFTWEPIVEVGILFAGIFICIIPIMAMLATGEHGVFAWLVAAVTTEGRPQQCDIAYF